MIASLPMYDMPHTAAANDTFWQAIRRELGRGPDALERHQDPHDTWADQELLLSQTCGLPFRSGLHEKVKLVGTPDYGLEGCPPGYYNSYIVVRADDPRNNILQYSGSRLARNDIRSQSGWAAISEHVHRASPGFRFKSHIVETGSHAASVAAVENGQADIASIDAVTWAILCASGQNARQLRVLEHTRPTPGLPYITGGKNDADALFTAITRALLTLNLEDRNRLHIKNVVQIPIKNYLSVPMPAAFG